MEYFEFKEPYYALVKTKNRETAINLYLEEVCEVDLEQMEECVNSIKEITEESAWNKFKGGKSEGGEKIPLEELAQAFYSEYEQSLLIDGSII